MPTYDYKCNNCNATEVHKRGMNDPEVEVNCKSCKSLMVRVFGLAAVTFSGDGFYSNDKKTQVSIPGMQ
jgi:putative FmdB family regulatory protein